MIILNDVLATTLHLTLVLYLAEIDDNIKLSVLKENYLNTNLLRHNRLFWIKHIVLNFKIVQTNLNLDYRWINLHLQWAKLSQTIIILFCLHNLYCLNKIMYIGLYNLRQISHICQNKHRCKFIAEDNNLKSLKGQNISCRQGPH